MQISPFSPTGQSPIPGLEQTAITDTYSPRQPHRIGPSSELFSIAQLEDAAFAI